jgi:hypothetical protein
MVHLPNELTTSFLHDPPHLSAGNVRDAHVQSARFGELGAVPVSDELLCPVPESRWAGILLYAVAERSEAVEVEMTA